MHKLISEAYKEKGIRYNIRANQYDKGKAEDYFLQGIQKLFDMGIERILFIIDEIEYLSFDTSPEKHWNSDFRSLWSCLRAVAHRLDQRLCFLVAGVNARMVETLVVQGVDNPVYQWISPIYIPAFTNDETRTMVRTLGRPTGLLFDEDAYLFLNITYGGHPYMIRQACSWLHTNFRGQERPIRVSVSQLQRSQEERDRHLESQSLVDQIIYLLVNWYSEEYEILRAFAADEENAAFLNELYEERKHEVNHLYQYGLIANHNGRPHFTIEAVRRHLCTSKSADEIKHLQMQSASPGAIGDELAELKEFWSKSSALRNDLEYRLRRLVRLFLKQKYAKEWGRHVRDYLPEKRKTLLSNVDDENLLSELYLSELIVIIEQNWAAFTAFEQYRLPKHKVQTYLQFINETRGDAHAKPMTEQDIHTLRVFVNAFDEILRQFDL
ncbi:MAG: hypothetical protein JNM70_14250 [Anaerolineae bacterium]|nr:hypothetical protein [Anaerolineae bacterium]